MRLVLASAASVIALVAAAPAHAAKQCAAPAAAWERATPAEAGMDEAKLQEALDHGSANLGFAVRVYRHGCLVGEDRAAALNRNQRFESWSIAKSVTALLFGRAMTKGFVSPDDPVGSLIPEASADHGRIKLLDLLTMTSGLLWNGFRDYNVFTNNRDRLHDALTLPKVHEPGRYYEYHQSPVALLAEAVARAVDEDTVAFLQRELMEPVGIKAGSWQWTRDGKGRILGYMGVQMRPDDYGRLGELLRRDGVWNGKRLLSHEFVARATSASRTNGCYGWLIWTNDGEPCVGVRITERPVRDERSYNDLPADMYNFSGLFGQLVTVFPTQGIVVVRTGQDRGIVPAGGSSWEHDLYRLVLAAVADQKVELGSGTKVSGAERANPDYGFQHAWQKTDEYGQGLNPDPLPAAGPVRARAIVHGLRRPVRTKRGVVRITIGCPPHWPAPGDDGCVGNAKLEGARSMRYSIAPGARETLRFRLKKSLAGTRGLELDFLTTNRDAAGGSSTKRVVRLR